VSEARSARDLVLNLLRSKKVTEDELAYVERIFDLYERDEIDAYDVFDYVMGFAWNRRIPLTPREVGDIARALGVKL
jgi:hypothetical protein